MKALLFFLSNTLFLATPGVLPPGEILFDTSPRVIFQPQSEGPPGLKTFLPLFEKRGMKVKVITGCTP
ncbi:MAG: hypothetical protein V3T96_02875 [Thermodesulfobacteriota bacterium]